MLEEYFSCRQMGSNQAVGFIAKSQKGMEEKGEDIHRGKQGREMFIAVAEVMFQVIALGFQRVVVLVLDLPSRATGDDDAGDVLLGDFEIGDERVFVELLAILVDDGHLAPIDVNGTIRLHQRHVIGIAIVIRFPLVFLILDAHIHFMHVLARFEQLNPLGQALMRIGLADEDKVVAEDQRFFAEWLMGINIVAQQRGIAGLIIVAVLFQPALSCHDLAVLLFVAVLRSNKLGSQWDGIGLAGSDNHGSNRAVIVGYFSALMLDVRAILASDFFRGKIPSAVQSDESCVIHTLEIIENALLDERFINTVVNGKKIFGRDRIKRIADMSVGGNLADFEERSGVIGSLSVMQVFLMRKERRRLGKEDRESAHADIFH